MPDVEYSSGPIVEEHEGGHGCEDGSCDPCGGCDDECGACIQCCFPCCTLSFHEVSVFGGVHGFKGPVDQGSNGNFGFHEGVNWATPLFRSMGIGFQLGGQVVHSDFHESALTGEDRTQYFVTGGFFHRPECGEGFQGGAVYDFLKDEFYDDFEVGQIRAEISYLFRAHEIGFWTSTAGHDDEGEPVGTVSPFGPTFEPIDLYAFFYRHHFNCGNEIRVWGGFTGESDGMVGADMNVPLSETFALQTMFNYVSPEEEDSLGGFDEAWNVGFNIVWHPRSNARNQSPYRPLFNVADNGTLIVDRE